MGTREVFAVRQKIRIGSREVSMTVLFDRITLGNQFRNLFWPHKAFENCTAISPNMTLCTCEKLAAFLAILINRVSIQIHEFSHVNKSSGHIYVLNNRQVALLMF